jgi:hypothetical protein
MTPTRHSTSKASSTLRPGRNNLGAQGESRTAALADCHHYSGTTAPIPGWRACITPNGELDEIICRQQQSSCNNNLIVRR